LIKIDIQGGEIEAFKGMRETIKASPKAKVIVEWSPPHLKSAGHSAGELPALLSDLGLGCMIALDDFEETQWSADQMLSAFKSDQTGRKYCNILAQRA